MIDRQRFVNLLRKLGYTFNVKHKRVEIWRKTGGTHRVELTTHKFFAEPYVRSVLRQCGLKPDEIEKYLRELKN